MAGYFTYRKTLYLSAGPVGEKDCPPLSETGDPTLLTSSMITVPFSWKQKGGFINDASCLNKMAVHGIVQVNKEEDMRNALLYAKKNGLKVSTAGVRHSMGGQAFYKNVLVLDMLNFKNIQLNEAKKTITVQSGATWHDIQNIIHPKYAVKAMQSTDIFTVGGSISVNAHGMDHQIGSIGKTIRSMRIMLHDGTVKTVGPTENEELFNLIVGGYGLFGIILDAELDITNNDIYKYERTVIPSSNFPSLFNNTVRTDPSIGLMYAHLSTAPHSLFDDMILYTYTKEASADTIPPLEEVSSVKLRRAILNFSKQGKLAREIKWFAEKNIEPLLESCSLKSRNQSMQEGEACLVSRNEPMHDSVKYLQNNLKNDTDILHEYFFPRSEFSSYISAVRQVLQANDANLLNASIRVAHKEQNFLTYAPEEMFSLVLYLNQTTDAEGNEKMKKLTQELIDTTLTHNGRFFLPYQLHYTSDQLKSSYPQIGEFFKLKSAYDPNHIFSNTFYETYAPEV